MDKAAWIVCNAFLDRAGSDKKNALLRFLPSSAQEVIKGLKAPSDDPTEGFESVDKRIDKVHYSWFSPFLRNLPENEIRLFLSALGEESSNKLQQTLLFSNHLIPLSPLARRYLQHTLFEQLTSNDAVLPVECLPLSSLNVLLDLPVDKLSLLVDFLGIHDLAVEIRQIIDTVKLKKIHSVLTREKEAYMRNLFQKKEPVVFKRMEIGKWDGKSESLLTILHHRGLNRLAKALYPEDGSLRWYISRRLPWEEAVLFQNLSKSLEHPRAAQILSQQVLDILHLINTKKVEDKS